MESERLNIQEYLDHQRKTSRDHARTPMQWDDSANAGFTSNPQPWFAVNPNYKEINAKDALADPDSIYHYYRRILALRKETPAFLYGDFRDLDPQHPLVFVYTRTLGTESYLIILNFSRSVISYRLPEGLAAGPLVVANSETKEENSATLHLEAWEARIYRC